MPYKKSPIALGYQAGNEDAMRKIVDALFAEQGNVYAAARALGLAHRTLYKWVSENEALKTALAEARDRQTLRGGYDP